MSEELLKAIVQLFAIVAKERITEDERTNIKEFLSLHLNQEATVYYLTLFDDFCREKIRAEVGGETDEETLEFVGEWGLIMEITKQINKGLTHQQKLVLIEKIIELILSDNVLSERQSNLIYYIAEVIKVDQSIVQNFSEFIKMQVPGDFDSDNILIIQGEDNIEKRKSKCITHKGLSGMAAVLRIKDDEVYFIKYIGDNELSLNGVPWGKGRISIFPTGSTIRGEKINSLYYSDVVNKFMQEETSSKITFNAEDLEFQFKSGDIGIREVNIAEEGGKLIGIMGASGSGKTTLLNILNGSETPSNGRVLINGIDVHRQPEQIAGVIGYVPQDDLLIEELSVYQNLYFAAKLCFSNLSDDDIGLLVEKTLRNLGLSETRNLKVGSPLEKTISGGQRKRLNIGLELLREPPVMFVDEPTSGLSSRDSENIMDLLKELSLRGKMIFVVIHQPSSDIFKMFDTLLILDVGGYEIYYGNPVEAVVYFKDTVNMIFRDEGSCPECGNVNPEQIFNIIETKVVNEYGRFTDQRKVSPTQWNGIYKERIKQVVVKPTDQKLEPSLRIPGWVNQVKIFFRRDFLAKLKNTQYMAINMLEAPVLAFFLAVLIRYQSHEDEAGYSYYGNDNIPVFFFMSIIVALFMGLTISAEEIIKDRKILKRESFLNLSRSSYLTSKLLILFGISAVQTLLFVIVGSIILEIRGLHLAFWLVLFSTSCSANMLGLNISSAFKSAITVYILIPLLLIPQLILSGVVVNFDKFNPTITNPEKVPVMGDFMTSRWAFEGLMVNYFVKNKYEREIYDYEREASNNRYVGSLLIPQIETKLSDCYQSYKKGTIDSDATRADFKIVRHYTDKFLDRFGRDNLPAFERFQISTYDTIVHNAMREFYVTLRTVYNKRANRAQQQRDSIVVHLNADGRFMDWKMKYHNNDLSNQVMAKNTAIQIMEYDGEFVRKYEPVFMEHEPGHFLDYRAPFYVPEKMIFGAILPTVAFNLIFIWFASFLLYLTLYYDLLRKSLKLLGRVSKIARVIPNEKRYDK